MGPLDFSNGILNLLCNQFRRLFLSLLLYRSSRVYPKLARNISRLTKSTVLKRGPYYQLCLEAEASRYVAQRTSIPIPAVYDLWDQGDGSGYLVMEYKEGEVLQRKWNHLTPEQKLTVLRILGEYTKELRALPQPSPPGWIGSTSGGPFFDFLITSQTTCGPFPNESAFNDWRASTTKSSPEAKHAFTERHLQEVRNEMMDNHDIVFTHGDLARYNILVRVVGDRPNDVSISAILDWEQSGWRPEYWEKYKFESGAGRGDWNEMGRREIFLGYDAELASEHQLEYLIGPMH